MRGAIRDRLVQRVDPVVEAPGAIRAYVPSSFPSGRQFDCLALPEPMNRLKPWRDCNESERLERIAHALYLLQLNVWELSDHLKVGEMPGYETIRVKHNPEFMDDYWGVYGGEVTKNQNSA